MSDHDVECSTFGLDEDKPGMIGGSEMRARYYRGEITRQVLWELERQWANNLGRALGEDRAMQRTWEAICERAGWLHWTFQEEQSLHAKDLVSLSQAREEVFRRRLDELGGLAEPSTVKALYADVISAKHP